MQQLHQMPTQEALPIFVHWGTPSEVEEILMKASPCCPAKARVYDTYWCWWIDFYLVYILYDWIQ